MPASQIATSTRDNDLYAWTAHYNVSRPYTANGLNQYTLSGSITPTFDRLNRLFAVQTKPQFNYDGQMLISEHNNVNVLQRRTVHDPGAVPAVSPQRSQSPAPQQPLPPTRIHPGVG